MELHEWLKTQPKEVQEEFEKQSKHQRYMDAKEMPVSQIYYGKKPISRDTLELIRYQLENLTEKQREIYELFHIQKKTQEEIAKELGISQQAVSEFISSIKKKIKKIL